MSDEREFVDIGSAAPAGGELGRHPSASDRQRDTIARWGAALEHHDADEVARLVRQSHEARVEDAEIGRLGPMVGTADTTTAKGGFG